MRISDWSSDVCSSDLSLPAMSDAPSDELTLLGQPTRGPVAHVETFPAPVGCTRVVFRTDEVASLCPSNRPPDISSVRIVYAPDERCIECKTLKPFMGGFRDWQDRKRTRLNTSH